MCVCVCVCVCVCTEQNVIGQGEQIHSGKGNYGTFMAVRTDLSKIEKITKCNLLTSDRFLQMHSDMKRPDQ